MNIKEINLSTEKCEILGALLKVDYIPTKRGTEYASMEITDKTGSINLKKWTVFPKDKEKLKKGVVIKASCKNEPFRGKSSLILEDYNVLNLDPEEFRITALEDLNLVSNELKELVNSIKDEQLKNICLAEMETEEFKEKFYIWPAAASCHHNEKGGLLYHTTRMMRACNDLASTYKGVINRDLLLTGAFFHDNGKLNEMIPNVLGSGEYAKDSLLGHIYLGAQKIHDYEMKGMINKETSFQLQHMILSHHGKLEWGSPVVPATPEAIVLHMVDNMDAKLFAYQTEALPLNKGEIASNGNWCLEGAKIYKNN